MSWRIVSTVIKGLRGKLGGKAVGRRKREGASNAAAPSKKAKPGKGTIKKPGEGDQHALRAVPSERSRGDNKGREKKSYDDLACETRDANTQG